MTCKGFVYIWYDTVRKLFYVGSHRGCVNDMYICSSKRMLNAYKKRPETFKRKIIKHCDNFLEEEQKYLDMIHSRELLYGETPRYYNVKRKATGGYTIEHLPNKEELIKKRYGQKHSDGIKRAIQSRSPEAKKLHQKRRSESLRQTYSSPDWKFYQSVEFEVYINGNFYKKYSSVLDFCRKNHCDYSTLRKRLYEGKWVIKQRRNHPFNVGDTLTFIKINT